MIVNNSKVGVQESYPTNATITGDYLPKYINPFNY